MELPGARMDQERLAATIFGLVLSLSDAEGPFEWEVSSPQTDFIGCTMKLLWSGFYMGMVFAPEDVCSPEALNPGPLFTITVGYTISSQYA
ncbi:hypothetical protein U1Q18_025080 [Sarracenia purpurea var. burkii]